jgi:acyl carrier protein phosphodiesterase
MNVLAHALLAGSDPGLILGSTMGDFVRGAPDESLPPMVREGIALHRAIDSFTDRHDTVTAARELFVAPYRRYAGILLDMWFDHCLARDFARWSTQPLGDYSARLRTLLHAHVEILPERLPRFLAYMDSRNLPASYADREVLGEALRGLSQRLSRANPVGESMPVLIGLEAALQAKFDAFFPDLVAFAAHWRASRGFV